MAYPVYSYDQIAYQLTDGYWNATGRTARTFNVTTGGTLDVDITGLTSAGQYLATLALQAWTDVTGISFNFVTNGGDISFDDNDGGAYSQTWTLGSTTIVHSHVNISTEWTNYYGAEVGTYAYQTYLHEIGHALGLGHAGNYNGAATYGVDNLYANDSWQASVMSYFHQIENTWVDASGAYVVSPMIADIIAIQNLYGTPTTTNTGDTTYGENSNASVYLQNLQDNAMPVTFTIYDNGGIDTVDFGTQTHDQHIDLRPEAISSVFGLTGNMIIARDTIIENAISGSGNDILIGNDANNNLFGGAGNDALFGGAGDDYLDGGEGADSIDGGAGDDKIVWDANDIDVQGGEGTDTLIVNGGTVPLYFNLGGHGFELATHNQTDSLNVEAWSSIVDQYKGDWSLFDREQTRDDGERWHTQWDVDGLEGWSEMTEKYDALSRLYDESGVYDNGNSWSTRWDLDNQQDWAKRATWSDDADISNKTSTVTLFNDADEQYDQTGLWDSGFTWHTVWDVDNTQDWARQYTVNDTADLRNYDSYTTLYNDAGARYDQQGSWDSGNTWHHQWDLDNNEIWGRSYTWTDVADTSSRESTTTLYDDDGARYDQQVLYDSGNIWHSQWDVNETEAWGRKVDWADIGDVSSRESYTILYDDNGQRYDQQVLYDSGNTWHSQWDLNDSEVWGRQTVWTDAGNTSSRESTTTLYDNDGARYDQQVLYDSGNTWHSQWDVNDNEVWGRKVDWADIGDVSSREAYTTLYTDAGQRYDQQGTWDSGNTWHNQWDVANEEVWGRQYTWDDVSDTNSWRDGFTNLYNDNGKRYDQTGDYDSGNTWHTIWDVDDLETWSRETYIYNSEGTELKHYVWDDVA